MVLICKSWLWNRIDYSIVVEKLDLKSDEEVVNSRLVFSEKNNLEPLGYSVSSSQKNRSDNKALFWLRSIEIN